MIIKRIIIENIQAIEYMEVDLDDRITRISGPNAVGKSTIVKSLELFAGSNTRNATKALIRNNITNGKPPRVTLILENDTALTAFIRGNSSVDYIHTDRMGNKLNVWNSHSQEILDLLGWKTVEEGEMCLNIKESHIHLFVNTKARLNGILTDYLCKNAEIENKIEILETKAEEVKTLSKEVSQLTSDVSVKLRSYPSIDENGMKRLVGRLLHVNNSLKVIEIYKTALNYEAKKRELDKIKGIKSIILELNAIKALEKGIEYNLQKESLERLKRFNNQLKQYEIQQKIYKTSQIKEQIKLNEDKRELIRQSNGYSKVLQYTILDNKCKNYNKDIKIHNNIKEALNEVQSYEKINKYLELNQESQRLQANIYKNNQILDTLEAYAITNRLEKKINTIKLIDKYKELKIDLENINFIKDLMHKEDNIRTNMGDITTLKTFKEQMNVITNINYLSNLNKNINIRKMELEGQNKVLEAILDKLKENNICPTCKQTINLEEYSKHTH